MSDQNFKCIELLPSDFVRYVPDFVPGHDLRLSAADYLQKCQTVYKELHDSNYHAEDLLGIRTAMIDRLMQTLFSICEEEIRMAQNYSGPTLCLASLGGYGRGEMNVYSDIDLLFLFPEKKGAFYGAVTEKILYILWDLGLEVGYSTRTIAECKKLMSEDVTIMTALLNLRFLSGNRSEFDKLQKQIRSVLHNSKTRKKFIQAKLEEKKARLKKYGDSVYVNEPHIKDAAGGLRDLQTPLWLAGILGMEPTYESLCEKEYLTPEELATLKMIRNFIWRIRNEMHLYSGKKTDQMTFERQEMLAQKMGYQATSGSLAVESFMQHYYSLAYQCSTITDGITRRLTKGTPRLGRLSKWIKTRTLDHNLQLVDGLIAAKSRSVFKEEPHALMKLFKYVQEKRYEIDPDTKDILRAQIPVIVDDAFRNNPDHISLFREMMNDYDNLGDTFFAMHEVHFLEEWFPEFKTLRCHVQHDVYHIYTTDTHSIFAVNELTKLRRGEYSKKFPLYEKVLAEVKCPEILNLGLFLHDIGKGKGGNHSVIGAEIGNKITERLQFSPDERDLVEFLIISHLMMPHLSQRRDLEDPELIIKFARSMGNIDNLNMLFLLTWADIRAVGPEAWNDWKGSLLLKLYEKTREVIEKGEFSREKTQERILRVKEALLSKIANVSQRNQFQQFLSLMPPRYFFVQNDEQIENHFRFVSEAKDKKVSVNFKAIRDEGFTEITVYSLNAPQVFSWVTGVMLAHHMNIYRADLYQMSNGYVLLNLHVNDLAGHMIENTVTQAALEHSLLQVLSGQHKIDDLIAKNKIPDYLIKRPVQKAQTKIVVDNDVSAYNTVIDVYAHDRLGLLYDITKTLSALGCYVDVSKISTKVEQVIDVFYVKDIFGHKITSADKIKQIKKSLQEVVESKSDAALTVPAAINV